MSDFFSSEVFFIKTLMVQFVLFCPHVETKKNFKDKENEWIIPVAAKKFQMSNQRYYPYQAIVQYASFEVSQRLLMR